MSSLQGACLTIGYRLVRFFAECTGLLEPWSQYKADVSVDAVVGASENHLKAMLGFGCLGDKGLRPRRLLFHAGVLQSGESAPKAETRLTAMTHSFESQRGNLTLDANEDLFQVNAMQADLNRGPARSGILTPDQVPWSPQFILEPCLILKRKATKKKNKKRPVWNYPVCIAYS